MHFCQDEAMVLMALLSPAVLYAKRSWYWLKQKLGIR